MNKEFEYYIKEISPYFFEGSLDVIASNILNLKNEHPEYKDLRIELHRVEDTIEFDLYGTRFETDEEYERRIEFEKRMKEHKKRRLKEDEEKERELYQILKKKYEQE